MSLYRTLFDHGATRIDAELAHRVGFAALRVGAPALRRVPPLGDRVLGSAAEASGAVRALGLEFDHVLGLAAGFDKNAVGIDALGALGFSHVEIGTVTAQPQPGNPQPRLFRLPADRAVLNRMGFNNDGAEAVARRLADRARRRRYDAAPGPIVGVNIGKTKVVPEEHAVADYTASTRLLAPYADYLVVNVSSPNTPGLRDLQAVEKLEPLLRAVRAEADRWTHRRVPLLVKIAPDLSDADVLATADLVGALELDGVIATNTTISRDGLATDPGTVAGLGAGGLSGTPVRARALEVLRLLRSRLEARVTVIGVGGIGDAADARERLAAGADLLQAYTGFIYGGPRWPRDLVEELSR